MNCNDLLAVALGGLGQFGTAANLFQGNFDLAVKHFGWDDPLTWRFANNLADTLRAIGAPSRAMEYDQMVLQKRIDRYGRDHFNVLVSANNLAQDYLDLGDYQGAVRSFELNRQIAAVLREQDPGWELQAEIWLLYTRLLSGDEKLDAANIAEMEAVIANGGNPALLRYKVAHLLADHFAGSGDASKAIANLELALGIANGEMGPTHPLAFASRRAIANARSSTDPAKTAADYAALDKDMLAWIAMQVMFAGNRDFAEATRALADDMLYDYARLAETNAVANRWMRPDAGPRSTTGGARRCASFSTFVDPKDEELVGMLRRQVRLSLMNQEMFAAGTVEDLAYKVLEESQKLDEEINARLFAQKFDPATLEKPLPTPRELLQSDQALVAYFTTRRWKPDREAAEPFEDVEGSMRSCRAATPMRASTISATRARSPPGAAPLRLASLRSTRTERGALPIGDMGDVFAGLDDRLVAPLASDLDGVGTLFVIPDGQ